MLNNKLAPNQTPAQMAKAKQIILDAVTEIHRLLEVIDVTGKLYSIYPAQFRDYFRPKDAEESIDKSMWRFVARSTVFGLLTHRDREKLESDLERESRPFTEKAAQDLLDNILQIAQYSAFTTIKRVYKDFTDTNYQTRWNHPPKRDNRQGIKQKFRIRSGGVSYDDRFDGSWSVSHRGSMLDDLYTVCKIIDGKGKHDYNDTFYALAYDQIKSKDNPQKVIETEYFSVQCFKNGNQQITFKRLDILKLFNTYGADKNELPDTMSKRYKTEHFTTA